MSQGNKAKQGYNLKFPVCSTLKKCGCGARTRKEAKILTASLAAKAG